MEKALEKIKKRVIVSSEEEEHLNKYEMLHTDEERVIFTLDVMLKYDIIPEVHSDPKNISDSVKFREQGNKIFVSTPLTSESCVEALKLYSKSVAYAPYPSEQLALAYANRSAVLIKLHKYEECVQDIDRALALIHADSIKAKLYIRKIECLSVLKHVSTEDFVKGAQQWLEKASLNDVISKKLNDKLISLRKTQELHNSKKQNNKKCQTVLPLPEMKTRNPEIPCASDALALKYNDQYGRHVVATRKIEPGEVIAIEQPYSLLLVPDNIRTHCSNCLEVCWANIPCDYCTYSMYCSEKCKVSEWNKYHDIECSVVPSLLKMNFTKIDLFCLRLAIQAVRDSSSIQELREELEEVDSCDDPLRKGFSKNGVFESNKYRSFLSLMTNTEKRSVPNLFRRAMESCFTLYLLATCSNMFESPLKKDLSVLMRNSDVTFVGGLILRHAQMVPTNMHTVTEEYKLDAVERGIAAIAFQSLLSHSCNANILRHARSNQMTLISMYPIEEGEQIFDSYSQHYATTPKFVRQMELLEQYYFMCNCIACQEDWPLFHDVKSFTSLVKNNHDKHQIAHAIRKLRKYADMATVGNVSDEPYIINDLIYMIKIIYSLVPLPCKELNQAVEVLKRVYDLGGNRFELPEL